MKKQSCIFGLILTAVILFDSSMIIRLQNTAKIFHLLDEEDTSECLRTQSMEAKWLPVLQEMAEGQSEYSVYEYITAQLLTGEEDQKALEAYLNLTRRYKKEAWERLVRIEEAVWRDLVYFPIPLSETGNFTTSFENSWMSARTFGGNRGHEGTDIMASFKERGHYPVVSMTDGTVEKIGWLPQGGYRIGIRAKHGGYFYYAHLYDYAEGLAEGNRVKAGELLGFMGDSGYSEIEGTVGNFDVHLHVGIYYNEEDGTEVSVNPYHVLRWLKGKQLLYWYE